MNRRVGLATEQSLKPPIGTSAYCGSKVAPGATEQLEGPFCSTYPGVKRVFWRRPARLEVFGPDGAHEHLERWTFAPSGMNRSRPYGRKLSRPPPSPRRAAADGKGPRRAPISVEGMPRCISSTLTGISRRRQILRMCPPKNLTPTSRMGHWEPSLSQIGVQLEAGSEQIEAMISYRSLPRVRSHRCGGNAADHEFGPGGNTASGTRTAQHVEHA